MKYEIYATRMLKQFVQLDVEAETEADAEAKAQQMYPDIDEEAWDPESASNMVIENIRKAE